MPAKAPAWKTSRHSWPIAISRGNGLMSAVWVWGDRELANQIVELLNSGDRDRVRLNGKRYRQRRAAGPIIEVP